VKISLIVEGKTERAFAEPLRLFLNARLPGRMPKLDPHPCNGRIPTGNYLHQEVQRLLSGPRASDAVIALTDVYTGTREFQDARDAKSKMRSWVGEESRFHPHAAQHDFEAWLLPYWPKVQQMAGHNKAAPPGRPEKVNHNHPPAERIREIFRIGKPGRRYVKWRDGLAILRGEDLLVAARACPELRAFLNTILTLCGGELIADEPPAAAS
jgi:hypothetical protein